MHSFAFFFRASLRNRALSFLRRLKSPRYALALIAGGVYFFFALGGPMLLRRDGSGGGAEFIATIARYLGPVALTLVLGLWWMWSGRGSAIMLSPAEAALLVPAPLSRRRLIEFKLLSAQPAIAITAVVTTMMLRGSPLPWWLRLPSAWLLFSTLQMHQTGAALVHAAVKAQGRSAWKRMWPAMLIVGSIVGITLHAVGRAVRAVRAATTAEGATAAVDVILDGTIVKVALAPVNAVLAPLNATTASIWPAAFAIAAVIAIVHYAWVINTDAAFEEGAAEAGAKHAAALEALRQGRPVSLIMASQRKQKKPWFGIPAAGEPAYGIWWKNVLLFTRALSPVMILPVVILPGAIFWLEYSEGGAVSEALMRSAQVLLMIGAAVMMFGPIAIRNDLRSDLKRVELLRTLPLTGVRLVTAEVSAAAFGLAFIQGVIMLGGAALMVASGTIRDPLIVALLALPLVLLVVIINAILLIIHNGFALFFPAWSRLGSANSAGIENFGQNILVMIGSVLIFALALVGPLLVAGASGVAMLQYWGTYAFIPAAFAMMIAFCLEIVGAMFWLGGAYDRMDPVESGLCR